MKKTLLLFVSAITLGSAFGQTTLFSEDFEVGPPQFLLNTTYLGGVAGQTGDNYWVINDEYTGGTGAVSFCAIALGQPFTVGDTPAQPGGITNANGNYLHMLSNEANADGILSASYSLSDNTVCIFEASHFVGMTADISTTGESNVTLEFWWLNNSNAAAPGELYYSVDGGSSWTQKTTTVYNGQSTWIQESLTDAAWDNQGTLRFGFRFNNMQATAASSPSFAIDDIQILTPAACTPTTSTFSETACFEYTVPSGHETYTTPGTATVMDTILNVAGCDSVMTITYTINTVDATMTNSGIEGTANSSTGTYQWIGDCNSTDTLISGETSQTLNIANAGLPNFGDYAVIVTDNGCTDTSDCEILGYSGIGEFQNDFKIFPNPTDGSFSIDLTSLSGIGDINILDLEGRNIKKYTSIAFGSNQHIELDVPAGIYLIQILDSSGNLRKAKLIIE